MIPDCSALRALAIRPDIRNPLIFLRKMATYSCWGGFQGQSFAYKQACSERLDFETLGIIVYNYSIFY